MSRKLSPLEWLTEYIEVKVDTSCEQKLVLSNLREVRDLLGKHVGLTEPICEPVGLTEPTCELSDRWLVEPAVPLEGESSPMVIEFVREFIDKLKEQLISDHKRWGNTWLNRPKEGQELRTKARYTDYFDMFEQAGTPVPWLKVIGGALICWIRERHPELCLDSQIETSELEEAIADEVESLPNRKTNDAVIEGDVCPISGEPTCGHCRSWIVTDCTKEDEYWRKEEHKSDCAVHNEPALPKSKCDCYECNLPGIKAEEDVPVEDATTKELVESKSTPHIQRIVHTHSCRKKSIAHVHNEKITNLNRGTFEITERIVLESVKFICHSESHPDYFLATCSADGLLIPASRQVGILGTVFVDGQYQLRGINGVGAKDVILVNYDYEYDLPLE